MRNITVIAAITLPVLIYGCATTQSSNELRLNREGNVVTGSVGPDWTDEELEKNTFRAICNGDGEVIADISINRDEEGKAEFSATCAKE